MNTPKMTPEDIADIMGVIEDAGGRVVSVENVPRQRAFGYIRLPAGRDDPRCAGQLRDLADVGIPEDCVYVDTTPIGWSTRRPAFDALLATARPGDAVVLHPRQSLSSDLSRALHDRGVRVCDLRAPMTVPNEFRDRWHEVLRDRQRTAETPSGTAEGAN